jgi:hypothetical protein
MTITNKDIPNKFIKLNKFLSNVCIIKVYKIGFYLTYKTILLYKEILNRAKLSVPVRDRS